MSRDVVTHAGHRLAYRIRGDGPPMLFIQGVGLHGDGWTPQIDKLDSYFTCISFDNRGTGQTGWDNRPFTVEDLAKDALAIMDAQGWGSAHIVGHSLGGLIALQIALAHRPRVKSLSLLCSFPGGKWAAPMSPKMLWLGLASRIGTRNMRRKAFLKWVMSPTGRSKTDPQKLAAQFAPIFGHDLADHPKVTRAQLKAMRHFNPDLSQLKQLAHVPTLVANAIYDPIAPPRAGRALAKAIPNARYVEWGDASHGVPIEQAGRVNTALRDHITLAESKAKA